MSWYGVFVEKFSSEEVKSEGMSPARGLTSDMSASMPAAALHESYMKEPSVAPPRRAAYAGLKASNGWIRDTVDWWPATTTVSMIRYLIGGSCRRQGWNVSRRAYIGATTASEA